MNKKQLFVIIGFLGWIAVMEAVHLVTKTDKGVLINISIFPLLVCAFLLYFLADR